MWIWTVKNQSRSDSTKKHTKGVVNGSLFYIVIVKTCSDRLFSIGQKTVRTSLDYYILGVIAACSAL